MTRRRRDTGLLLAAVLVLGFPREPGAVDFPCDVGSARIVQLPQLLPLEDPPEILDASPAGDAILGRDSLGQYIVWLGVEGFSAAHLFETPESSEVVAISNGGEYAAGRLLSSNPFDGWAPIRLDRAAGRFDALDGFQPGLTVLEISGDGEHLLGSIRGDEGCSGVSPTGRIAGYARVWGPGGAVLSGSSGIASSLVSAIDAIHNPGDQYYGNVDSVSGTIGKWMSEDGTIVVGTASDSVGVDLIDPNRDPEDQVVDHCKTLGVSLEAMRASGGVEKLGAPVADVYPCATHFPAQVGTLAYAVATAASQDGSVTVGYARDRCACNNTGCFLTSPAFAYYSRGGGFQKIFTVVDRSPILLRDRIFTSHDGRIVVGLGNTFDGAQGLLPLVWDPQKGRRRLQEWLDEDLNVSVTGWSFQTVDDFELGDGGVVVGQGGRNGQPVAYAVQIPCLDSDADGLCNGWEDMQGIDLDGDDTITSADVALPFADAMHKDLYVEVDSFFGADLKDGALDDVEQAFADVPNSLVRNPDGRNGIALHLLRDEDDVSLPNFSFTYTGSNPDVMPNEMPFLRTNHFGSPFQRAQFPDAVAAQARIYRYMVFGGNHWGGWSGQAEPWGNDLIVTLEGFRGGSDGSRDYQAGTIMHELGHTLGLEHGGRGSDNQYLPNYKSVMSYIWQLRGAGAVSDTAGQRAFRDSWVLDYSRRAYNFLSEAGLREPNGIGGDDPSRVMLVGPLRGCRLSVDCARVVTEKGAVDWDEDGDTNDVPPAIQTIDIDEVADNGRSGRGMLHRGHDDWTFVAQNFCTAYQKSNWDPANVGPTSSSEDFASTATGELEMIEAEDLFSQPLAIDCDVDGVDDQDQLDAGTAFDADGDGLLDHCEPLRGDVDEDGDVDPDDQGLLFAAFGLAEGEAGYQALADLDRDRRITLVDYQLWIQALDDFDAGLATTPAPAAAAAAEEAEADAIPTTACGLVGLELLLPAAIFASRRRTRRQHHESHRGRSR